LTSAKKREQNSRLSFRLLYTLESKMKDINKAKEQLLDELAALRQRISELEKSEDKLRYTQERLRESEEKYRNLVEKANDGIAIIQDRMLKYVNPRVAEIIGYSAKEVTNTPFLKYVHPEELSKLADNYKLRMAGEKLPSRYESIILHKDRYEVYVEINASIITYQGRPADIVIVRDITERKKAEERIKFLAEVLSSSPFSVIATDKEEKIIYANPSTERLFGYTSDELLGKNPIILNADPNADKIQKNIFSTIGQGKVWRGELLNKKRSGEEFPIYASVYQLLDKEGNFIATVGFQEDISERKKAEEALQASEAFNFALFQYNPMEIMVVDYAGKIIKTNLARRKSGNRYPNIGDVMYKDYATKHKIDMYAELMEVMRSKKTKDFPELEYGNKYLSIIIAPFPMGAIIISQDITKLKQAERQIKASLREKEILLQEIHHRVKNNMQVISSILNLQSRSIKSKKALEIFKSSQDRVRSMALIHERLYQSKDFTKVDFSGYVQSLAGYLFSSYGIGSDAIRLAMDIKDISLGLSTAIPCGLIINELVSNSLKHAFPNRKKGEIKIALHPLNENEIGLIVSDNGIGLPNKTNFRKTKSLGLHLVTILAEDQLQGEIKLDRTKGTSFQIKLKVKK
jgi:PAS domain S-box-containing protein